MRIEKGEKRPWGGYRILEEGPSFKVKRIWVDPGHRLSYQTHAYRSEHWVLIDGKAKVILDGREFFCHAGDSIDIPQGATHRIENIGEDLLSFIEVQRGKDLTEDDVTRLEDDYGRANTSTER